MLAWTLYAQELAADPMIYDKLVASLAPSIWQMDDVKKGVLCQLFGGVSKVRQRCMDTKRDNLCHRATRAAGPEATSTCCSWVTRVFPSRSC